MGSVLVLMQHVAGIFFPASPRLNPPPEPIVRRGCHLSIHVPINHISPPVPERIFPRSGEQPVWPVPTSSMPGTIICAWCCRCLVGRIERGAFFGMDVAVPSYLANHEDWSSVDVEGLFSPLMRVPIAIENGAAAIGEMQFGLSQNLTRFLDLLLTFALGGGAMVRSASCRSMTGRVGPFRCNRSCRWHWPKRRWRPTHSKERKARAPQAKEFAKP